MSPDGEHRFPCQACGSQLRFDPGAAELRCVHCGAVQSVGGDRSTEIPRHDFREAIARAERLRPDALVPGGRVMHCPACGATSVLPRQAGRCPFCDTDVVFDADGDSLFAPESAWPFAIDARAARARFRRWVRRRWFAPNDLRGRARAGSIEGVFLPYWSFDGRVRAVYTGRRGRATTIEEPYLDARGRPRVRNKVKVRWRPAFGTVSLRYRDELVPATRALPAPLLARLRRPSMDALRRYDPALLAGFTAHCYSVDLETGFADARDRIEPRVRGRVRADIGGDRQQIVTLHAWHSQVQFRHLLRPVWLSSFRYGDRVYRFLIDGVDGRVIGERPWSAPKIALAVLASIAAAGLVWWLARGSTPPP